MYIKMEINASKVKNYEKNYGGKIERKRERMKQTVAFCTLGCKVNTYETEAMCSMFETRGYKIVDFKEIADVYVVNTCTVTNIADRKSRQMLHQAKKRNPQAVIVAVGCYVQAAEETLLKDNAVDLIVGNNNKSDVVAMVERYFNSQSKEELVMDLNQNEIYEDLNVITTMEKTRAFIKIQDGCNRFCSYCIIPYVRGRVRSREEKDILAEIQQLAKKGYKEVVLTGIHISSYGIDRKDKEQNNPMPLAELLKKISNINGIKRIRLGSLEPGIISEEFVKEISSIKEFCPHFHLSLQSGSDTVLQRMNRKYTAKEYHQKVELLRKYFENPAFTTDIIVGFPGETEQEFKETLDFVQKVGFSQIHVFKYSKREGTKAAKFPDQILDVIKSERSNQLLLVTNQMAQEYQKQFLGKIEKILLEEEITLEGKKYQIGHNTRYLKLAVMDDCNRTNQIVTAKICNTITEDIMLCERID